MAWSDFLKNSDAFWLQRALNKFNTDKPNCKIIKEGATIPSEADINAKIQELKDVDATRENDKTSGKQKLKDLGLTDAEIKALTGA